MLLHQSKANVTPHFAAQFPITYRKESNLGGGAGLLRKTSQPIIIVQPKPAGACD